MVVLMARRVVTQRFTRAGACTVDVMKTTSHTLCPSPTCGQSRTRTRRQSRSSVWEGRSWWCRRTAPGKRASQPDKHRIYDVIIMWVHNNDAMNQTRSTPYNKRKGICVCLFVQNTNLKTAVFSCGGGYVTILSGGRWHKYSQLVLCNLATKNVFIAIICGPSLIPCTR